MLRADLAQRLLRRRLRGPGRPVLRQRANGRGRRSRWIGIRCIETTRNSVTECIFLPAVMPSGPRTVEVVLVVVGRGAVACPFCNMIYLTSAPYSLNSLRGGGSTVAQPSFCFASLWHHEYTSGWDPASLTFKFCL